MRNTRKKTIISLNGGDMKIFIRLAIVLPFIIGIAFARNITSNQTGDWNVSGTWIGGIVPSIGDTATIASGHIITVTENASVERISVSANASAINRNGIDINSGSALSVTNAIVMTAPTALTSEIRVSAGNLSAGSIAIPGSGTSGRNCEVSVSTGTITTTGSITFSGTAAQARFTSTDASIVNIGGNFGSGGTLTTSGIGTINFNGSVAQTIGTYTTYNNITINNSSGGVSFTGTTIINGTLADNTGTINFNNITVTVVGATNVNGTLNITSTTGTKTFGDLSINNGGVYNNSANEDVTINGNLQNNSTFTAGTGIYTLAGVSKTLSGNNPITIANLTINTPNSYTSNTVLMVSTALAGTGSFTNGVNATLNIGGTSTIVTLDASATGNTVNYYSTTAGQTVKGITYHNLTITKSAQTASLGGAITVNGNLTITSGILTDAGYQITGNGIGIFIAGAGTTINLGTATVATAFPTNFTSGNITLNLTNTVNYNSNLAQTISSVPIYGNLTLTSGAAVTKTADGPITINGNLTIGNNNTLGNGGYQFTAKGNVTNNVSFTGAGKMLLVGGSAIHSLPGSGTFSNLELDDLQGASMGASFTVSGNFTVSNGTFNCNTRNLNVGGDFLVNGSVTGTGTVTLTGTDKLINGIGTVSTPLTISTGAKSISINANLIFSGTVAISGAITVTNNGVITTTAAGGITGSIVGSTWINNDNSVLNIIGPLLTTGTLTANASGNTVNYNGISLAQTIKGTTYYNLIINKSSQTATLGAATVVTNDLTVTSGILSIGAFAFTINGTTRNYGTLTITSATGAKTFNNLIINNGGVFNTTVAVPITITGNLANDGSFSSGTGTYTLSGSDKILSGNNAIAIPNLTLNGTYTNNATVSISTSFAGTGTLTNASYATLNIGVSSVLPTLIANANDNTVNYNASGLQTVKPTTYYNLTLSGSGAKTTTDVGVEGVLSLQGTATVTATPTYGENASLEYKSALGAQTTGAEFPGTSDINVFIDNPNGVVMSASKTLYGILILRSGTLSIGSYTIRLYDEISPLGGNLSGGASSNVIIGFQTAPKTMLPEMIVNSLSINRAAGLDLTGNVTVNGVLSLQSGIVTTGSYNVTISSTGSIVRTNGHINGNLRQYITSGSVTKRLEIGDNVNYTPIDLIFKTVNQPDYLSAITTPSEYPNIQNSGLNPNKSVNRYWTITNNGVVFDSCIATFNFVSSDLDPRANPDTFFVAKQNGTWTRPPVIARTAISTQVEGITSFSDFVIGELNTYIIEANAIGGGTITPPGSVIVNHGSDTTFYITPDGGFHLDSVVVDGTNEGSPSNYTFTNLIEDHAITAYFSINNYTITATAEEGGSISPAGSIIVNYGSDTTFIITPDIGYHINDVLVDDNSVGAVANYEFTDITDDHTINATFEINTYSLNIITVGNGAVIKVPDQLEYEHGTEVTLTAEAEEDWTFSAWSGDTNSTENPITITINSDKNITATFTYNGIFGWSQIIESMPSNDPRANKYVKDGGSMVTVDDSIDGITIYAFRGNKSNEFYKYTPGTPGDWMELETIPYGLKPTDPTRINKKKVGKGASLCYDDDNIIYATKGNSTREFWAYDIEGDSWIAKAFLPYTPVKGLKGGTSIAYYDYDNKVYLLAGGQKVDSSNFFVYTPQADTPNCTPWVALTLAPITPHNKPYKDGSCITLLDDEIYFLKGSDKHNFFFKYDIETSTWSHLETIPLLYPVNLVARPKKSKVKDGGAMTNDGDEIYVIKGGGTQDLWRYTPGDPGIWTALETIPRLNKKSVPKTGAALTYGNGKLYLLKGNNTPEIWQYTPPFTSYTTRINNHNYNALQSLTIQSKNIKTTMNVTPNPCTKLTTIHYTVPIAGKVTLKLYNSNGGLVETLINNCVNTGVYTVRLSAARLAKGVYFLKYQTTTQREEIKLIIQ
jgi:hypothetical protein